VTTQKKQPEPESATPKQCTCKPERQILRDGSLMETHLPYCHVAQKTQVFS